MLSRRSFENLAREGAGVITTRHTLRTSAWTADVQMLETAIGGLMAEHPIVNDCQVAFFEIAGDDQLHVNVTHRRPTLAVRGWAGPARLPEGFVHNRRFGNTTPSRMIRHIREMIFAAATTSK